MLARVNDFDYLVAYPLSENSGLLHVRLHEIIIEKGWTMVCLFYLAS